MSPSRWCTRARGSAPRPLSSKPSLPTFCWFSSTWFSDTPSWQTAQAAAVFTAAKIGAFTLGAWLDLLLVPHFEARHGNGGIGIALSSAASEIVMTVAAVALMPSGTLDRTVLGVSARSLCAGAAMLSAGILLSQTPFLVRFIGSVGAFAAAGVALRLVGRDDLEMVRNLIRTRRGADYIPSSHVRATHPIAHQRSVGDRMYRRRRCVASIAVTPLRG